MLTDEVLCLDSRNPRPSAAEVAAQTFSSRGCNSAFAPTNIIG